MEALAKGATYVVMIQPVGVGYAVEDATRVEDAAMLKLAVSLLDRFAILER